MVLLRLSCSGFHIRPTNSPLKAFDTFSRSSRITSSRAYTPSSTLDVTPKLNLIRPVRSCPRSTRSTLSFVNKSHGRTFTSATGMQTSFTDPERPDLYYHLFDVSQSSPVFALSFLPDAPTKLDSSAIIGWLPAETRSQSEQAGLNDFKENPKFLEVLHEAVQSGLRDGVDDIQINGAIQTQQGWMHIHDDRNIPALGRIGDPDDIIGSVRVEEGKILPETYQPMPSYRLCTSDGIMQLTEGLAKRLNEILVKRIES